MKKTRFKEEQMVKILRDADQPPVAEVAKRHGVSVATIYGWRQRFGKLEATDVKHLRHLEQENARLKKMVAERDLELNVMKEINRKKMVSAQARQRQVEHARKRGLSTRRACALLSVARSTLGYESRLAAKDAPVVEAMKQLSLQYPRFGYRRIHVMLARQGQAMSVDRAWRIWQQHGLQVPRKRRRRRVAASRPRPLPANGPNQGWAYDFVFDACANGQQLKCLTVIDEFTRECLAIDVASGIRSGRVIEVSSKLITVPYVLRSGVRLARSAAMVACRRYRYRRHRAREALAERL